MGHCIYIIFVYYVMFYQFVQQCITIRTALPWFIVNSFISCSPRGTEIAKAPLMIRTTAKDDFDVLVNKIMFSASISFKLFLFICLWANLINFFSALHNSLSTCFKIILQSGSSFPLWYLLPLRIVHFLPKFDEEYVSDFVLLLRRLTRVWFRMSVPNSFCCGIPQQV